MILFSRKNICTYARDEPLTAITVSEGASGATVSTGATSALPTILIDAKT